jgi:methionyl-tRNA synthetase
VQDLFISANIDFTDYIRTTEERHIAVVEPFWVSIRNI